MRIESTPTPLAHTEALLEQSGFPTRAIGKGTIEHWLKQGRTPEWIAAEIFGAKRTPSKES